MNTNLAKLKKALAIALVVLQIPMLMLWKITMDTVIHCSSEMEIVSYDPNGGAYYGLVFQWDKLGGTLLSFLPILLALAACLILSVTGLISVLRKKQMELPPLCFYAVTMIACGFLCYAFARPFTIAGLNGYRLELQEFMFYRYLGGMELHITDFSPLLKAVKFILLGLHMVLSGGLCGLGIADMVARRKAVPETEELPE